MQIKPGGMKRDMMASCQNACVSNSTWRMLNADRSVSVGIPNTNIFNRILTRPQFARVGPIIKPPNIEFGGRYHPNRLIIDQPITCQWSDQGYLLLKISNFMHARVGFDSHADQRNSINCTTNVYPIYSHYWLSLTVTFNCNHHRTHREAVGWLIKKKISSISTQIRWGCLPWCFAFCLSMKSSCKYRIELAKFEQWIEEHWHPWSQLYGRWRLPRIQLFSTMWEHDRRNYSAGRLTRVPWLTRG
jgi:hypothetical protein